MGHIGRRKGVLGAAIGAAAVLVGGLLGAPPAESAAHYPVIWSFLPTATLAATADGPGVPPPGANMRCTPSAAHPFPVILVHGLAADQNDNWQTISPFLANSGYCVYALTYGNHATSPRPFNEIGGLSAMEQSAQVLAGFVNSVLATTHAIKVDIVGHSEGGTMPDYYLKFLAGSHKVAHFVALSGVMHGTTFWGLANLSNSGGAYGFGNQPASFGGLCDSCGEFLTGSSFLRKLDAPNAVATAGEAATCPFDGAAVEGVSYTSLATRNDELVRPPTSDFIDPRCADRAYRVSVDNIVVQDQCAIDQADHLSIASDPVAAQDILNALDPAHQRPVRCSLVLPSIG